MGYFYDPEFDGARGSWTCCACGAENSRLDGECQSCDCEGMDCKRDSCSDPLHFHRPECVESGAFNTTCDGCIPGR